MHQQNMDKPKSLELTRELLRKGVESNLYEELYCNFGTFHYTRVVFYTFTDNGSFFLIQSQKLLFCVPT